MTRYVGLIGYPLGHSVSPAMQQAAFDHYGLDIRYQAWQTEPERLGEVFERLRQPQTVGANVTVPHKEAVLPLLDELDDLAQEIGAVNTVVNRNGRLVGYNTDAGGFLQALKREGGFDAAGRSAVMLGAGGAARAVGFALARAGARSLVITDIVVSKAQGLAHDLQHAVGQGRGPQARSCVDAPEMRGISALSGPAAMVTEVRALSREDPQFAAVLAACELLVNCTPIGMRHSAREGQSPIEAAQIPGGALVYDIVYNPIETRLLADAREAGAGTLGGLAMLVYQGGLAFELWAGREAPIDIMMEAARGAL